jgi:hypothetical protein
MEDDPLLPIGEVLRGPTVSALPESWTSLEAICMIKCLGEDGSPKWAMRMTDGINEEELLGALVIHTDLLKRACLTTGATSQADPVRRHRMHRHMSQATW